MHRETPHVNGIEHQLLTPLPGETGCPGFPGDDIQDEIQKPFSRQIHDPILPLGRYCKDSVLSILYDLAGYNFMN